MFVAKMLQTHSKSKCSTVAVFHLNFKSIKSFHLGWAVVGWWHRCNITQNEQIGHGTIFQLLFVDG